jgi:cytoskeletal protein RodZ
MVETVGRRLQKARQEKKLTIDEVAAATKIRPERIVDLEADDLTRFPSLVYARSFLVKYARFLGLDIQDDLENFQVNRAVGFGEFKYLTAVPPPKYRPYRPEPRFNQPAKKMAPPLILAVIAVLILIGVPLVAFFAVSLSRLSPEEEQNKTAATLAKSVQSATPIAVETPEPAKQVLTPPTGSVQIISNAQTPSSSSPTVAPSVEVRRALPVTAADKDSNKDTNKDATKETSDPSPSPTSTAPPQKLEIKVKERTWVRVTKDRESSEPVFNGFIGPSSPAIVIQGNRFWLKALDKGALELRKNGQAVNGQDGDIVIE